jgi:DNA-directed RNA polymerase specialized sigma24 family protein
MNNPDRLSEWWLTAEFACKIGRIVTFPLTRKSAVYSLTSSDSGERKWAFELIVDAYWAAICKYIRLKWNLAQCDAEDLTQSFFGLACEKNFFQDYDPGRARFRTYLRVCVDRFVMNEKKSASRIKRGGQTEHVTLDFEIAAEDECFERECMRSLFHLSVETLLQECDRLGKGTHFRLFERYDLEEIPCTYDQLAVEFGLSATDVTNYLAWVRRRFRQIVLELREQIDPS